MITLIGMMIPVMEQRGTYIVIGDVDDHERQEGDEEAEEDGEHHPGETQVLLAGHLGAVGGGVRLGTRRGAGGTVSGEVQA